MDKYLITSFKSEIANAILNMQEKLNPDKDAYISKDELPNVLDFFGVDDVSKLMKSESEQTSIFENKTEEPDAQVNEDTVEISNPPEDQDDAISTYGTAAYELNTKVKSDLTVGTAGNPYAQQIDALVKEKESKINKGENPADVIYKIDAMNALVNDYLKEHPDAEKEHLTIDKISYGKNGEKKALLSQTFGISGNNAFNGGNTTGDSSGTVPNSSGEEGSETGGSTNDSGSSSSASAIVNYNIDFRTLNDKYKGNWHIKGTVNAGSENSDLHGAFQYTKAFNNDSSLNFTGDLRETIKNKNNSGSYGAAIDYRLKKFSAGGYGMYYHKEVDGVKEKEHYLEMYGKYGNTFIGSAGLKHYNDIDYKYVKGMLQGKKELPDSGLSFKGGVGAEYGVYDNDIDDMDVKKFTLKAKGGITFKSKDINAELAANIATENTKARFMDYDPVSTRVTTLGVMGKVETKTFDISTAVSAMGVSENGGSEEFVMDDKTSVTASIVVGVKNLFGKKVMPILKYNVGNYDGAAQNVGAGVIITP